MLLFKLIMWDEKKTYNHIIFDFDGTIADSASGILNSLKYTLTKFGVKFLNESQLIDFIGPPLLDGFQKIAQLSLEDALLARQMYRDYYIEHRMFDLEIYPEIPNLLNALKAANKTLYIATSKPQTLAIDILKHFNLLSYFSLVLGAKLEEKEHNKAEYIKAILDLNPNSDKDEFIMIGDRMFDIRAAAKHSIDSIGVTYGFGKTKELEAHGATYILNSPEEIRRFLLE